MSVSGMNIYVAAAGSKQLPTVTGQAIRQHLHRVLTEQTRRPLPGTALTVNETAFRLGLAYPQ